MKKFKPPARRKPIEQEDFKRVLGQYGTEAEGPTVIFIGSLHGNEPAGAMALKKVFDFLSERQPEFQGSAHALAGNLKALKSHQRYIDIDLNRTWIADRDRMLGHISPPPLDGTVESLEKNELKETFYDIIRRTSGPYFLLDLHTVSSESAPFINIGDTMRNRKFARQFPLPVVLGIEEQLHGTFLNYTNERGFTCIGFEAGQHDNPESIKNSIALIWQTFAITGCMREDEIPFLKQHRERLKKNSVVDQSMFELRFRYAIGEDELFRMKPGYRNFDPVTKDQVIAENQDGDIRAQESGRIFMPLYQKQGEDGFFLIRSFSPFWLTVSAWMRRLKLDRLLPLLPGIGRHPKDRDTLIIDLRIARWYVMEVLHLLGYRRERKYKNRLIATKRKYDLKPPNSYVPKS